MTTVAQDLHRPNSSLALWYAHDLASKTDLFSTAVKTPDGRLLLIDPIGLAPAAEADLLRFGVPAAILVTNSNHWRASPTWAEKLQLPFFAAEGCETSGPVISQPVSTFPDLVPDLAVIEIQGAPPGEIALHWPYDGGTLIVGDALIHFDPYGLAFLPAKYCQNQKQMQKSLHQLLNRPFERLFFAHGLPILHGAFGRVAALLKA